MNVLQSPNVQEQTPPLDLTTVEFIGTMLQSSEANIPSLSVLAEIFGDLTDPDSGGGGGGKKTWMR